MCVCVCVSPDWPDCSAPGSETWPGGDCSLAAELRSGRQHPGRPGNHGPDVRRRAGPHARGQAAAGEEPVRPDSDRQGEEVAALLASSSSDSRRVTTQAEKMQPDTLPSSQKSNY